MQYGIIRSTSDVFVALAIFGLAITGTKFIAQHRGGDLMKLARVITLVRVATWTTGGIIAVTIYFASDYLAASQLNNSQNSMFDFINHYAPWAIGIRLRFPLSTSRSWA